MVTGWISEGKARHPTRYFTRGRQLLGTHIRARSRAPTIRRGPAQAPMDREPAVGVRPVDQHTVATQSLSRSRISALLSILSRMGYFISTSSISSHVVPDPVCVLLFREEPALCNTVDSWNAILMLFFVSQSSSFRFRLPLGLAPGPQLGVGFCWYRTSFTLDDGVTESG